MPKGKEHSHMCVYSACRYNLCFRCYVALTKVSGWGFFFCARTFIRRAKRAAENARHIDSGSIVKQLTNNFNRERNARHIDSGSIVKQLTNNFNRERIRNARHIDSGSIVKQLTNNFNRERIKFFLTSSSTTRLYR